MDAYESTREYWKSKDVSSQEALAAELQTYMVLFAWQNCLLEDLDVSADEVRAAFFEDGAQTPGEAGRLLANQRSCFELLLPLAAAGEDLTPELVERVNALLCEGMDIEADDEDDSLTPEELREALVTLLGEVNAYDGPEALRAAAYFAAKLEYLQPFTGFCGLTARILASHFLLVREEPPLVFFEKDAEHYFDALETYDIGEDLRPLEKLMREQTVETWKTLLSRK